MIVKACRACESQWMSERDRYKKERDELLLKLAETMDVEALEDAKQIPSARQAGSSQSG